MNELSFQLTVIKGNQYQRFTIPEVTVDWHEHDELMVHHP